jgi:hypothetical protein
MRFRLQSVLVVAVLVVGCGSGEEPAVGGTGLAGLLPNVSSMDGWQIADGPTTYDSETLFEYLNGGAPLYLDFGFEGMVHVRYQLGDDSLSSVTLDVYDMGSDLGAFGLYRSGRPPGDEVRDWGAEGYRSGTVAAAWKGGVSIHAQADDEQPELIEAMEALVEQVANAVVGDNAEGTLFFSELAGEPAVTEAMAGLRAHHEQWGEIVGEIDAIEAGGFRFTDPGLGSGAVVSTGSFVAGVHGGLPSDVQMDLLGRLVDSLGSASME